MSEIQPDFHDYYKPPSWLSENFFIQLLRQNELDNKILIKSFSIEQAVAKGEHYASCMYRIQIDYSSSSTTENDKTIRYICKIKNLDDYMDNILKTYNIYEQEMNMYQKYIPKFETILSEVGMNVNFAPRTAFINFDENSIIFEDLKDRNYEMAPRVNGLDRNHAKLVIKKLAKFHAVSVIYNRDNDNELSRQFDRGMFNRKSDEINDYFRSNFDSLAREVGKWPGWEYYAKKLTAMKSRLVENARNVFDPKDEDFNVLTHGDLWVNNLMFKYDVNRRPLDVLMVDFQMPTWGTPAIDVLYFIATSLSDDLREHCEDEFIQYYHDCLVKCLQLLKYPQENIPTLHQIQIEFLKNYFYSFSSTVLVLPVMMSKHSVGVDFRTLLGHDDKAAKYKENIYGCEKFQKILKRVLPIYDKKGILDL